ncbi:hypothetical protein IW262DRAFT_1458938 [Armillaria fumosa]|nr:hypothetical protein IW262DRAFT_1458938 [Armillaria fumosa]
MSVDSILVGGHVLALSVGAVPPNSALNVSNMDAFTFQMPAENVRGNTQEAAAIAWAENALGSQYMFRLPSNGTSYIIPVPENLPTTTSVPWLTDVVALNPSCAWQETNISSTLRSSAPVVEFDFTNIPTFTIAVDSNVYQVGVKACSPKPTIETREVLNDDSGNLSIEPRVPRYNQGNLHPSQTAFLLSFALSDLHDSAGPTITFEGFGTELEAQLFFYYAQVKAFNITLDSFTFTPVSDQEITDMYTRLLQSASKVFVSGNLGSVYVPGRTAAETAVFTSSLPVIVASTALFAVLSVFVIAAHFREGKEAYFTLYSVAAALDGSNLSTQFAQLKNEGVGEIRAGAIRGSSVEDQMAAAWGVRKVLMTQKQDGHGVLRLD